MELRYIRDCYLQYPGDHTNYKQISTEGLNNFKNSFLYDFTVNKMYDYSDLSEINPDTNEKIDYGDDEPKKSCKISRSIYSLKGR